ncbi:unnamed protein product [Prorocentrum cordatum]|uniref:EGF-like domain-containing protein n=1 Tax=Prorocentrum cordatum TaxID=2364126 RepID=A0ABN9YDG4_9DINO|nr:unnamed protein product [Polarella glacialis]
MALALLLATLVHAAVACASPRDCSYNGHCGASSACVCAPQWTGPRCETLNLLPARKDGGFRSPHAAPEHISSWGGSILYDESDGLWHMFAAEMANGCGINHWEPNSQVVHATAAAADGPYTYRSTVLEPFAHEPNAVRAPDGTWVIYLTLRHPNGEQLANCSETNTWSRQDGPPPRHTYMVHAPSPDGPWSAPQLVLRANTSIWNNRTVLIDTNLAVAIPASSVVGIWRKCENSDGARTRMNPVQGVPERLQSCLRRLEKAADPETASL